MIFVSLIPKFIRRAIFAVIVEQIDEIDEQDVENVKTYIISHVASILKV